MKLIVDKLPETANECLFSTMGTGRPRCRHDAKLCPLQFGKACPHLKENTVVGIDLAQGNDFAATPEPVEPKKRTTKRSTAKKEG